MKRFLPRLTYANVIASVALFIALGGAAVAAGLPRNSVGPRQLKRGSVTPRALRHNAVRAGKIAPRAVTAGKLGPRAVLPNNLGPGIISTSKIAVQAVNASRIKNNVVTTNKLNNRAVTTQKMADDTVSTPKLVDQAVTTAKLDDGSVTAAKLADGSVTAAKLNGEVLNNVQPLKSGQTLRGVFDLGGYETAAEATPTTGEPPVARSSVTFQQALLNTPAVSVVPKGGPYPPQCPGLGGGETTPSALPGWLCIYATTETNLEGTAPVALTIDSVNRLGIGLAAKAKKETKGDYLAAGVWAVTAP